MNRLQEIEARLNEIREMLDNEEKRGDTKFSALEKEVRELKEEKAEIEARQRLSNEVKEEKEENRSNESEGEGAEEREEDIDEENRENVMDAVGNELSTRGHKSSKNKEKEIRSAFARFVVGEINESEARSLGIEAGNGSVTIPEVIASEIITYAQEENLLRKYGSTHRTAGDVKYPVLVKKAEANVRKKERGAGDEIAESAIEFDEILLDPAEFDALATVTKKLIKRSGVNVEQIVIDELKKAYVRKETNYMFNGDDVGNENPGALVKKAVGYYESTPIDINAAGYSQKLHQELVKMKGQPVTEVLKKAMWIINRAALTVLEGMTDTTGRPLLQPDLTSGVGYKLLGHKVDFTDAADGADSTKPVFYFGDFKTFHIQDVIGAMELQKLIEKFSGTNKVGFQIYNLLDGQLVYSPFEPSVYRYEVGAVETP